MKSEREARAPSGAEIEALLRAVAKKRVYFGHQSVGENIVEGLRELAREHPAAGLRIIEGRSAEAVAAPGLAHAKNGQNEQPESKLRDFAETLGPGGLGDLVDVALLKFCYVDFTLATDLDRLFEAYRTTITRLRQEHPRVRFVHVTVPLTVVQSGPRAHLKWLLGRPPGGAELNAVRERFNERLRQAYSGREPLFDLAAAESTLADGETEAFRFAGRTHRALAGVYSSDGKHLNAAGSRWVAWHLLQALAAAAD